MCIIYEARPANCAGFFATTSPERCAFAESEDRALKPEFALTNIEDVVSDTSFYFNSLRHPVTLYAPVAVYRILTEGYSYLNQFAGLEDIKREASNDPEIRFLMRAHQR